MQKVQDSTQVADPRPSSRPSGLASSSSQPITEQRWELKRKHALISTDLELLAFEVGKARKRIALSPATTNIELSTEERHKLATSHANKLKEAACKLCPGILKAVRAHKWAWPFNKPVDLDRYKDYLRLVREPMDLETISQKLDAWQYSTPQDFEHDMRLVFANCRQYNNSDQEVVVMGNTVESKFDEKWSAIIHARLVDIEVAIQAEEANMRQGHLLASHARAAGELEGQWQRLAQHFTALQAAIADAKAAASRLCKPLSYDGQVRLSTDLGQLSPEHFDRGMEALILARDEALERHCETIEDYDLHLAALDPATQHALQSYAQACLRPRGQAHPHLWPGFVIGSGIKGIPASGKLPEAAPASAGVPASDTRAAGTADRSAAAGSVPQTRAPQKSVMSLWPPPKPPLPPLRSSSHAGARVAAEQGAGIAQSDWPHTLAPKAVADAGATSNQLSAGGTSIIVLQPGNRGLSAAIASPTNAAASEAVKSPGSDVVVTQAFTGVPASELAAVQDILHASSAQEQPALPVSAADMPTDTAQGLLQQAHHA